MRMMLNLPQRRTKGDVYFNRDWESYKNGFGEPDGDFWLGNEAVHILTYVQPYELRIEIRSDGKDYFAHYKTFKVESESDKYRLRLGAVSGTLGGGSYGLSYSNNMFFTTFDRDNDESSSNCALSDTLRIAGTVPKWPVPLRLLFTQLPIKFPTSIKAPVITQRQCASQCFL
ncbi:hypothetical protein RRG08_037767 [Elysia crispata]|uniref:Fibrinogen C-terminal domain-containing protein n=1 Tax=Elysia crispata TaxID=231223 RepID=A0AAE1A855_9GAST|nr:hypothetical protein RRG08_037767 [Elysia crispata]